MTRMNYSLNHSRSLGWDADHPVKTRKATREDWARKAARKAAKNKGFPAKYPGRCATCHAEFPRLTLIKKNRLGIIVHSGGCPSK